MNTLFSLLQFAGGTFPTGAFSQSWGLETYICLERIKKESEFKEFLQMYIHKVLGSLEGPIFCKAYELTEAGQESELEELEEQFTAMRLTKETRESSLRTGKAFMRIVSDISDDPKLVDYYEQHNDTGISFPVAFAIVCARQKTGKQKGLEGFFFSTVNGLIQSGLKLIPLGNTQAQKLLLNLYEDISEAAIKATETPLEDAFAFCPGLDIASMKHETLPTRLYMT